MQLGGWEDATLHSHPESGLQSYRCVYAHYSSRIHAWQLDVAAREPTRPSSGACSVYGSENHTTREITGRYFERDGTCTKVWRVS